MQRVDLDRIARPRPQTLGGRGQLCVDVSEHGQGLRLEHNNACLHRLGVAPLRFQKQNVQVVETLGRVGLLPIVFT
jgi:hypothetical protein